MAIFPRKSLVSPTSPPPPVLSGHSPHQLPLGSDPTGDPRSEWEETGKPRLRRHPEHRHGGWEGSQIPPGLRPRRFF